MNDRNDPKSQSTYFIINYIKTDLLIAKLHLETAYVYVLDIGK